MGSVHAAKIIKVQDMALKTGSPVVGLLIREEPGFKRGWLVWPGMQEYSDGMYSLRGNPSDFSYYGAGCRRGCLFSSLD